MERLSTWELIVLIIPLLGILSYFTFLFLICPLLLLKKKERVKDQEEKGKGITANDNERISKLPKEEEAGNDKSHTHEPDGRENRHRILIIMMIYGKRDTTFKDCGDESESSRDQQLRERIKLPELGIKIKFHEINHGETNKD